MPFGRVNVPGADPHDFVDKMSNLVLANPSEGARVVGLQSAIRDTGNQGGPNPDIVTAAVARRITAQDVNDKTPSMSNSPDTAVRVHSASAGPPLITILPLTGDVKTSGMGTSSGSLHAVAAVVAPLPTYRENAVEQGAVDEMRSITPKAVVQPRSTAAGTSLATQAPAGEAVFRSTRISTGGLEAVAAAVARRGSVPAPEVIDRARSAGAVTQDGVVPPLATRPTNATTEDGIPKMRSKIPEASVPQRAAALAAGTPLATPPLTSDARARGTGISAGVINRVAPTALAPLVAPREGAVRRDTSIPPLATGYMMSPATTPFAGDADANASAPHTAEPAVIVPTEAKFDWNHANHKAGRNAPPPARTRR